MRVVLRSIVLTLLGVGTVHAAGHRVPFSPIDLANGSVPLPEELAGEESDTAVLSFGPGGGKCDVVVSGGTLAPASEGGCPQLFANPDPKQLDAQLTIDERKIALSFVSTSVGSPVRLSLSGSAAVVPKGFPGSISEVAVLRYDGPAESARPTGWAFATVEEGQIALEGSSGEVARRMAGRFRVYGVETFEDDTLPRVWEFQVLAGTSGMSAPTTLPEPREIMLAGVPEEPDFPEEPDPGEPGDPGDPGDPGLTRLQALPPGTAIPAALKCPPPKLPHDDMIIVCVDATGPVITYRMVPEGTRLTKPNRYFFVHVVHHAAHRVSMDLGGQIGSYVPGTRGKFQVSGGGFGFDGQVESEVSLVASTRTFAPRRPGFAPLVVRLYDQNRTPVADPLVLEFWVDETYSGAFRVGVAGVFFGGVEQQYSKVLRANSQQEEIAATGENVMDVDLTIGYSPYLDPGGRAATGCESAPFCFQPYFGLGILSPTGDGDLDWLKSVHLGVEWELTAEFAIGVTANVRRVSRLTEGLRPGYPVEGDIPTEDRYVFGIGIIVNLSPSFLRIGAGGAAGILK